MDHRLLLVKSITLLYRESLLSIKSENSSEIVRKILETIQIADTNISLDKERDILNALKATALEMCENTIDHDYEKTDLLQRLKLNCLDDDTLYDTFIQAIEPEMTESNLKRSITNSKKSINNHFRDQQVDQILHQASTVFRFNRDKIKNVQNWISDLLVQLEPFQLSNDVKDPAIIGDVDTSNLTDVTNVFTTIKEETDGISILRTGYQDINTMLAGGFRRGETVVIGALQHKYKTGFSLTLFKQMALYNKPVMIDPLKKPLLLRISAEDSLTLNFQFLYQSLKENETGEKASLDGVTEAEMAEYVKTKLAVNGYHTRFIHINPSLWTYKDLCNKIVELEAEGYEVHCCMMDYLLKLPTTGCDQGPAGHDIRNMYERVRNFMSSHRVLFITPHQFSTDAKMLIRDGRQDFVKELVGRGYFAGSKQIDQVYDLGIFIHIEELDGEYYLTVQRDKHRIIIQTPPEALYRVYKFQPVGGIPDDLGKINSARKKVGGRIIGDPTSKDVNEWNSF